MAVSFPDCDILSRLPPNASNAVCIRCSRSLAGGPGPRQWVYCDRRNTRGGPSPSAVPSATAELIQGLGRYEIGDEIGRGGMGLVIAAHDRVLDRDVALKVQIGGRRAGDTARKRFAQELKTLARLRIQGLARLLDGGVTEDGLAWYVMERVHGPTLEQVLIDAIVLPRPEALAMVAKLARTLAEVHAQGLAHRDVKPSNILLALDGSPVLVDFGLVTPLNRTDGDPRLTVDTLGTPLYMAPEQTAQAWDSIDWVKVDVYALGMVLIESLTGSLPPGALPAMDMQPEAVQALCAKATHRDPRKRFNTPEELADAIDDALHPRWWASANRLRTGLVFAGLFTLVVAIPGAMVLSASLAQNEREALASERLDATWARIEGLPADDPDIEATFQAFINDPGNVNTDAWRQAWRRRALSSNDPTVVIESWASAWIHAEREDERDDALRGLVDSFLAAGRWEAINTLLVDTDDADFLRAGHDPNELRINAALHALRMDDALALMSADDPRRPVVQHLRTARTFPSITPYIHVSPIEGWLCDDDECLNVDGRHIAGPISALLDGGVFGALFYRRDFGLIREDGSTLCELPFHRVVTGTVWNGTIALATGDQHPGVELVNIETCTTTPLPLANAGLGSWVTSLQSVDVDSAPGDELIVATGASYGYELRAISSDGQRLLDTERLGDIRNMAHMDDGSHTFVSALSSFYISPYYFPEGIRSGVSLTRWAEDGFADSTYLRHPILEEVSAWMVSADDMDADGDVDIAVTHADPSGELTIWLRDGSEFQTLMLGQLTNGFLVQLDDDEPLELATMRNGQAYILGLGDVPIEPSPTPALPSTEPGRTLLSSERLRRLGLLHRSAEEAERSARTLSVSEATEAWNVAANAWLTADEPLRAAGAYIEAAKLGDRTAPPRALSAYMAGWALDEASQYSTRIGLPTRAPQDIQDIDFSRTADLGLAMRPEAVSWSASRQGLLIQGTSGMQTVLRFEVERRADIFGLDLEFTVDRMEWAGSFRVRLVDPATGKELSTGESAHGGDGELYRSFRTRAETSGIRDLDPRGPHNDSLLLAYDRQKGEMYMEGTAEGRRLIRDSSVDDFDADTLLVEVSLPYISEIDAAVTRMLITKLTLYGLVPTDRPLPPIEDTPETLDATWLWQVRQDPSLALRDGPTEGIETLRRVFEAGLHMHPLDAELRQLSLDELDIFTEPQAIDQAPYTALLVADNRIVAGHLDTATAVYQHASQSTDPHIRVLAYAGLAEIADIVGDDPTPLMRHALQSGPTLNVAKAWIRRRRLTHLIPDE